MSDDVPRTLPLTVIHGQRTPQLDRDRAYEVWSTTGKQSCDLTGRQLHVEGRTIRRWCRDDSWRLRLAQDRADASPRESLLTAAVILRGSAELAAQYLADVTAGLIPGHADRLTAAKTVLDRVGLGPIRLTVPLVLATDNAPRDDNMPPTDTSPEAAYARIMHRRDTESGAYEP